MRARVLLLATALLAGACRSGPRSPSGPAPLEVASAALDLDEREALELQLEPLFADGVRAAAGERFWAGWLLAQAQGLAAADLRGPGRDGRTVAALYFAQRAAAEEAAARFEAPSLDVDGPRVEDAAAGLDLLRATWLEELGFSDRAAWSLDQLPALEGAGDLAELLSRAELHERLEPRVWRAVFEDRARRAPAEAFLFAVGALRASDRARGALAPAEVLAVERWIEEGAPFLFRCPDCGQAALPQLRACPNDQTALERFQAVPRP